VGRAEIGRLVVSEAAAGSATVEGPAGAIRLGNGLFLEDVAREDGEVGDGADFASAGAAVRARTSGGLADRRDESVGPASGTIRLGAWPERAVATEKKGEETAEGDWAACRGLITMSLRIRPPPDASPNRKQEEPKNMRMMWGFGSTKATRMFSLSRNQQSAESFQSHVNPQFFFVKSIPKKEEKPNLRRRAMCTWERSTRRLRWCRKKHGCRARCGRHLDHHHHHHHQGARSFEMWRR
jgi:hypothetical protein